MAALTLGIATVGVAAAAPPIASASTAQISMMQDQAATVPATSAQTFAAFRSLGATAARVFVPWSRIAPNPTSSTKPSFDATNPSAYPAANWVPFDQAVLNAKRYGITADLIVAGGAPQWAEQKAPIKGYDFYFAWKPNAAAFGQFMKAIATRYSGRYTPPGGSSALPRVSFWTIFNEPNFGENLGPQATNGSKVSVAPNMYRQLVNAGWSALHSTGHGHDTILVGGYAARGMQGGPSRRAPEGLPGNFAQTKPLLFIRTLYCVDRNNRVLRGKIAKQEGCPTNRAGSRKFKSQNPGLFKASGVSDHPYPDTGSPTNDGKGDPNFATFLNLGKFGTLLDTLVRIYGSHKSFPIYNDEYGYITRPPAKRSPTGRLYPSPDQAAVYINQAEYLSWKNPRIKSYMQYLLTDPAPNTQRGSAGFASGLEFINGTKKATYFAFNLPVWMPKTSFSHRNKVEVWGDARPAVAESRFGAQKISIQFQKGGRGAFTTVNTVSIKKSKTGGYFDIHMKFASSGNVRLAYTYPATDPLLPLGVAGSTINSRVFKIKVH